MFDIFHRIKNGLIMLGLSLKVFWQHKTMIIFPFLKLALLLPSYIGIFLLFLGLIRYGSHNETLGIIIIVSLLFLAMLLTMIISTFIDCATIFYTVNIFEHRPLSILKSFKETFKIAHIIIIWSCTNIIALMISNFIKGKRDSNNWARSLVGATLHLAWSAGTFFVTPIITLESKNIIESIRKSAQLMKQTFGETIGLAASLGAINSLLFPGLIFASVLIADKLGIKGNFTNLYVHLPIFILSLVLRTITSTSLQIFKTAAYQYAEHRKSGPFDKHFLIDAFRKK